MRTLPTPYSIRGFTLIEILIALVVFLFIGLGATYGLARGVSGNTYDSDRQNVLNTTQSILDTANPATRLCSGPSPINTNTTTGVPITITIACTPVTLSVGNPAVTVIYNQVHATATWSTKSETRSVTLTR